MSNMKQYRAKVVTEQVVEVESAEAAMEHFREAFHDRHYEVLELVELEREYLYSCDDCGGEVPASQVEPLTDAELREVCRPGEIVPAGKCPDRECNALIYLPNSLASAVDKSSLELIAKLAREGYYADAPAVMRVKLMTISTCVSALLKDETPFDMTPVQSDCTATDQTEAAQPTSGAWSEEKCPRVPPCSYHYANGCSYRNKVDSAGSVCACPCHRLANNR